MIDDIGATTKIGPGYRAGIDRTAVAPFAPEEVARELQGAGARAELSNLRQGSESGRNAASEGLHAVHGLAVEAARGITGIARAEIDQPFSGAFDFPTSRNPAFFSRVTTSASKSATTSLR